MRALLVRLALEPGRTVGAEALVQALWPEGGPGVHALQALVSRLRRCLPGGRLRSVPGGYVLDVESVDAPEFERLAGEGKRALRDGDAEAAAKRLREALRLWRGDALVDAAGLPFADAAAVRLEALRVSAVEDRVAAELAAGGEPARLVAELEEMAALHPLRERPRALLVEALHRGGRSAEALAAFEQFRGVLADELGAGPGEELHDAYLTVLRQAFERAIQIGITHGELREDLNPAHASSLLMVLWQGARAEVGLGYAREEDIAKVVQEALRLMENQDNRTPQEE